MIVSTGRQGASNNHRANTRTRTAKGMNRAQTAQSFIQIENQIVQRRTSIFIQVDKLREFEVGQRQNSGSKVNHQSRAKACIVLVVVQAIVERGHQVIGIHNAPGKAPVEADVYPAANIRGKCQRCV